MRRAFIIALVLVAVPVVAHAQDAGVIDQIVQQFQTQSKGWAATLQRLATNTFWILVGIQFLWSMAKLGFRRPDFSDIVAELVNQIMFVGIFSWLLTSSQQWNTWIIQSFRQAGAQAGGLTVLTPSDIIGAGIQIAGVILAQISFWDPSASAGIIISGLVVIVCFALMCASVVIALVRSYFIANAGVFFLAFGGSMWTSDIAVNVVRKTMSIGAGLFALQLILSIGMNFIQQWVAQFHDVTAKALAIEIGSSIVLLVVSWVIPEDFANLISPGAFSHGGALLGAGAGAAGAVGAAGVGAAGIATNIAGAGALAGSAARLASTQVARSMAIGSGPSSSVGRIAALTGHTVRNMASATAQDVGRRLSGQSMVRGNAAYRITADLQKQTQELEAKTPSLAYRKRP